MALVAVEPWRPVPDRDALRFDAACCQCHPCAGYLTNLVTMERCPVGAYGETWLLDFDDDDGGEACLFCVDNPGEPFIPNELLKKVAWVRNAGGHDEFGVQAGEGEIIMPCRALLEERRIMDAELKIGAVEAVLCVRVTFFARPRSGCHCFWDMAGVYSAMKLTQFGGKSYMWLNHMWAKFVKAVDRFGFAGERHMLKRSSEGDTVADATPSPDEQVAEHRCVSTMALLALVCVWALGRVVDGGFKAPETRASARRLLEALVFAAVSRSPAPWVVHLAGSVNDMDPGRRPMVAAEGSWCLYVPVTASGFVGLSAMREISGQQPQVRRFLASLDLPEDQESIAIYDLLTSSYSECGAADTLCRQIVFCIARRLDEVFFREYVDDDGVAGAGALPDGSSELSVKRALGMYLNKASERLQQSFVHYPMLSGSSDIANIRGLGLYGGAIAAVDNSACWPPPQVITKFADHVGDAEIEQPGVGGEKATEEMMLRQLNWLKRGADPNMTQKEWRPKKRHGIVVRRKAGSPGYPVAGPWLLPLCDIPDSACVFWRVAAKQAGADNQVFFDLAVDQGPEPTLLMVWGLEHWEGQTVSWVSPARQSLMGLSRAIFGTWGVRAVSTSGTVSLLKLGAKLCFWDFGVSLLQRICVAAGLEAPPGGDLFALLWLLIASALETADNDTLAIMGKRLDLQTGPGGLSELMELDECGACLHERDRQEIMQEVQKISSEVGVVRQYKQEWKKKKAKVVEAIAKAAAKAAPKAAGKAAGRGRGRGKGDPPAPARPKVPPPDVLLEQAQVTLLKPPGSYVWRSNTGQAWCGHFAPYSRVSKSWHLCGGNRPAAIACLRVLWQQWLEFNHKRCPEDCGVEGLFEESADAVLPA